MEILRRKEGWARIRCEDSTGATWTCWMMDVFLLPVETKKADDGERRYTVTVPGLTAAGAQELLQAYPEATKMKEV